MGQQHTLKINIIHQTGWIKDAELSLDMSVIFMVAGHGKGAVDGIVLVLKTTSENSIELLQEMFAFEIDLLTNKANWPYQE